MNVWSGGNCRRELLARHQHDFGPDEAERTGFKKDGFGRICRGTDFYQHHHYETKRGLLATQATQKMKEFNKLRQKYGMLGTDNEIVLDKASEIYAYLKQRGELLPDADILIAAVALTQNLTLVTADNHFDRIEGLRVENWLKEM